MDALAKTMKALRARLHLEEFGATAVEYGLMVALIAAVIIGAVSTLGGTTSDCFTNVNAAMEAGRDTSADCN